MLSRSALFIEKIILFTAVFLLQFASSQVVSKTYALGSTSGSYFVPPSITINSVTPIVNFEMSRSKKVSFASARRSSEIILAPNLDAIATSFAKGGKEGQLRNCTRASIPVACQDLRLSTVEGPGVVNALRFASTAQIDDVLRGVGSIDVTFVVQQAAKSVPSCLDGGGRLFFQPGRYLIHAGSVNSGGGIVINSCTYVEGTVAGTIIVGDTNLPIFINQSRNMNGADFLSFAVPTTIEAQIDHDITVDGFTFDLSNLPKLSDSNRGLASGTSFLFARNVRVTNTKTKGTPSNPATGVQFLGSDNVEADANTIDDAYVGVDTWKGNTHLKIHDNNINMAPASAGATNRECINVNAVGSKPSDNETTSDFFIHDNFCQLNGNAQAFDIDTLGAGSTVQRGFIYHNIVVCSSENANLVLIARGSVFDVVFSENIESGCSARDSSIVIAGGFNIAPVVQSSPITTTAGSTAVTLYFPNHNTVVGRFVSVNASSSVGGLKINSMYRVLSVMNTDSVVIQSVTPATSSETGGGATSEYAYYGLPDSMSFINNHFHNSSSGVANALINVGGSKPIVSGNSFSGTGDFAVFIQSDSFNPAGDGNPGVFHDNTAPNGSVPQGALVKNQYLVNGVVALNKFIPSNDLISPMPPVQFKLNTSGFSVVPGLSILRLVQSSPVETSTITLPTIGNPDGFLLSIDQTALNGPVKALSFRPAVEGWVNGVQLNSGPGVGLRMRWNATTATWQREQ